MPGPPVDAELIVRELFAAFGRRDAAGMVPFLTEDAQFYGQGTAEALGRTDPYIGHAGIHEYIADVPRAWAELEVHPTDVRSAGRGVVCFGVAVGRLLGAQEPVRIPVIWVFKLRGSRIGYARAVASAAEAAELVGTPEE
jgi:ketosteroid isomerase-like protein